MRKTNSKCLFSHHGVSTEVRYLRPSGQAHFPSPPLICMSPAKPSVFFSDWPGLCMMSGKGREKEKTERIWRELGSQRLAHRPDSVFSAVRLRFPRGPGTQSLAACARSVSRCHFRRKGWRRHTCAARHAVSLSLFLSLSLFSYLFSLISFSLSLSFSFIGVVPAAVRSASAYVWAGWTPILGHGGRTQRPRPRAKYAESGRNSLACARILVQHFWG